MKPSIDSPSDHGIIIGTGPSLSEGQIAWALRQQKRGVKLFGVNNVYQMVPWIDCLLSCNIEWWDWYWNEDKLLRRAPFDKWTWDKATADRCAIKFIQGKWGDSLSTDPTYIHFGHASGYQILGLAYHYGIRHMYLLGYDMKYPPGEQRHFFGEYPQPLLHFPQTGPNGEFTGLIKQFETIDEESLGLKVWNLSPGSALDHFEKGDFREFQ